MRGTAPPPPDERIAWMAVALLSAATFAGLWAAGFSILWQTTAMPLAGSLGLWGLARFYRTARRDERLAATCASLSQLVLFTMIAAPLSYLAASLGRPLADAAFVRADLALGFDWRAYLALVDAHPGFARILRLAYESTLPQLAVALCVLGFSGQVERLREFVWAMMLAGLTVIAVSAFLPAVGAYPHFAVPASAYAHIQPAISWQHLPDILGARDGGLRLLALNHLQGIITFPSFHAALATLFAWAFWQHRAARWPGLVAEALVLLSTPVDGGHYLSDVLAGIATAICALAAARWALGTHRRRASGPMQAAPLPA